MMPVFRETGDSYVQMEAWFEVSRGEGFILVINSYGRLRKLYTEEGKYEDLSEGVYSNSPTLQSICRRVSDEQ